jgi:hypothetical protein
MEGLVSECDQVLGVELVTPPHFPVVDDLADGTPGIVVGSDRGERRGVSTCETGIVVGVKRF